MIYINRNNPPNDLAEREKKYLDIIKQNNLRDNDLIYKWYKQNYKKEELGYSTSETKKILSEMCNMRCPFCGKIVKINTSDNSQTKNMLTIEHMKPQESFPMEILNWDNLLPCCSRCNSCRKNKPYNENLYLNPTTVNDLNELFDFTIDGEIIPSVGTTDVEQQKAKYMIDLYNLNSNSKKKLHLKNERSEFFFQILDENFEKILALEKIDKKEYIRSNSIIFYDMYLYNERRKK